MKFFKPNLNTTKARSGNLIAAIINQHFLNLRGYVHQDDNPDHCYYRSDRDGGYAESIRHVSLRLRTFELFSGVIHIREDRHHSGNEPEEETTQHRHHGSN